VQVLALTDPNGRQARLLAELVVAFAARGLELRPTSQPELAREATIQQDGLLTQVRPDRPLLWLTPGLTAGGRTAEDRFVAFENYSAARAVALLTRAPVLNRPSLVSPCGTLPANRATAVRQAVRALGVEARPERFASRARQGEPLCEVLDYSSGRTAWRYPSDGAGPFRERRAVSTAPTAVVHVVGSTTLSPRPVPDLLRELSIRVAELFALDLASVWWTGSPEQPHLARVECWQWDVPLGPSLFPVARAVADWMAQRLQVAAEAVA
jgi:hypothetical protein